MLKPRTIYILHLCSIYIALVQKNTLDRFASETPISKISVLMAAYNEELTFEKSVRDLVKILENLPFSYELIIVESNSTDNTRSLATKLQTEFGYRLILQPQALGKGFAIREAFLYKTGDVFLIYDADGEYNPGDIPKLLSPITSGASSFVLGTRHQAGFAMREMSDYKVKSMIMNYAHKFFTFLINLFFGTKLTDPFTMYKIFRAEVFENIELVSNRFDFDWELVGKAIRRGSIPIEVPILYVSRSFSEGKKIRFFYDPMTWIIALIRFRFGKL
jgi:glycosyltransferase involved in cell wall biosynthesis